MAKTSFRSALVTGASSGIGEQIARTLAARGCALTLVARRTERLAALAQELGAAVAVDWLAADLSSDDGIGIVERRLGEHPVELLVNNAGVGSGGRFHELPAEGEAAQVMLNVLAVVRLTRAAAPAMVAAGRGGILNVSSIAGNQPLYGYATYGATKAFVTSFTESIAFELRGTGVHVSVLKPGYTDTEMNAGTVPDRSSVQGRLLWLGAEQVAVAAVDAVERGRVHCVPGMTWKLADAVTQSLPRAAVRVLSSRVRAS
ncbi:MAG: uncharacterized protein QOJ03_2959 [Frankiaceae bacterium]|nr:uncharacterized protein [Frankiaceae bacterium]